ncbi:Fatty acyl-CoA synthetase A [Smittium culicis]|uniref:Fatty acyl-CoA synthetase A n=1 Tax=Smittium culicis TaxID=133412 RepID=A0A1R1Y0D6_9FUNG|nr:Fatty acyl-CoA synthetase A [Smittium culicis]OMJ26797.1 Fatty acyl-CoA synthetase A [Smittium culicis]
MYDLFWSSVYQTPEKDYLGYRPYDIETKSFKEYEFYTYKQIGDRVNNLASGIINIELGLAKTEAQKNRVRSRNFTAAIYSSNRPEWSMAERALLTQSCYSVALYDTLGEDSMEYIINHSESSIVFCSLDKVARLLRSSDSIPEVKTIICFDSITGDPSQSLLGIPSPFNVRSIDLLRDWAREKSIGLYDIHQVEELGKKSPIPHSPPKPSDPYTILYTSGTTGNPKGVVCTHHSYATCARLTSYDRFDYSIDNVYISYLPLAHCYGRNMENIMCLVKGKIGYSCGDITKIVDDCRALQPTIFPGIPRLLNRFYDVLSAVTLNAPGLKGVLYRHAYEKKLEHFLAGNGVIHPVWDKLLFNNTRAFLSNKLIMMGSGSASLEPHVQNFLRMFFIIEGGEGYGMTETCAGGIGQLKGDLTYGNIGVPGNGVEVRLRDVPEMGYYTNDEICPRGEICIRGAIVFSHYLKEPEKTQETMLGNGWFATGDIAKINPDGNIAIIDRKKSLFKLSQGEYISPEKIENCISKHPLVLQSFVDGISSKNYPVAVIVPDPDTFIPWAKSISAQKNIPIDNFSLSALSKNKALAQELLISIQDILKSSKMNGFEVVKSIYIEHVPFDVTENKLLTPTLKLKRADSKMHYRDTIIGLYENPDQYFN